MKIAATTTLSETQLEELRQLSDSCRIHDNIQLSYPTEECGDGCCHFLLYEDDHTLASALAMLELNHTTSECSAFTHPSLRRRGYFSRLLECALNEWEDRDILFAVCESCPATMAVLRHLGAELESREHQMELDLAPEGELMRHDSGAVAASLICRPNITLRERDADIWELREQDNVIGHGMLTPVSDLCTCLHHVEIAENLRGQGYGSAFMALLLSHLATTNIRKVILQVSDDNQAALSLYRKTGFRFTETLSYYLY